MTVWENAVDARIQYFIYAISLNFMEHTVAVNNSYIYNYTELQSTKFNSDQLTQNEMKPSNYDEIVTCTVTYDNA